METLLFHPKLVHMPIALGVLMPLIAGGLLLAWWQGFLPARAWLLAIALQGVLVVSGALALRSGEAEEERVEQVVPENAIEAHEEAAEAFVWASAGVLGLMALAGLLGSRRSALPLATVASLGTLAVLGLCVRTGEAGGALVYRHRAAQAYTSRAGGAPPAQASSARSSVDDD